MAFLSQRMLILVAALLVLGARYACEPVPVAGDPTLIADLGHLTRTAAAGHALQIQPGVSVNKAGYDLGMFFYPSVALSVFPRWLAADLTIWPKLQLAAFAMACALMVHIAPLRVGAAGAGVLALGALFAGDHPVLGMFAFHYYGYWAPPLASLVSLVWMLALPRVTRRATVATALFVGALAVWRVDAGAIPGVAALLLALVAGVRHAAARLRAPHERSRRDLRTAAFCIAFVLIGRVPDLAVRAALTAHQASSGVNHFSAGRSMGHMRWHNLYLSYSADELNPLGIEWDDLVGWLHAIEHEPRMAALPDCGSLSDLHDAALGDLYVRTALEDPALWWRAFTTRADGLFTEIGPAWIGLALAALALAWALAWAGESPLAIPLPWGRVALRFDGPSRVSGWGHGPVAVLAMAAAAALPPLFYNASPWYVRAAKLVVRAGPLLLAAALAARRASGPRTPETDRLVLRAALRVAAAGAVAILVFFGAGFAHRAATGRPLTAPPPPPRDAAELARRFDKDPRELRASLAAAPAIDISPLVDDLVRTRPSARIVQFPTDLEAGTLRAVAQVRGHLLVAFKCARAWPKNALVRGRGGWLTVSYQGARFQKYQLRIPPLSKGDDALWMLPVLPGAPPSLVTISLREMGEPLHDPGVHLGDVLDLVRAPGF